MKRLQTIIVTIALIGGSHYTMMAQMPTSADLQRLQAGIWYDTELQADYHGNFNHVNLLYLSADYQMCERWKWHVATLSIAKTSENPLVDDLQTFSNIEEENLPLALALCGAEWDISERHTLHVGVRNMNEDYFTSPITSLFTNSSCGIFPTLSCNLEIANYPMASMGIHYSYDSPSFHLLASLYNGKGYKRFAGRENVWSIAPQQDGLLTIVQGDWTHKGGQYYLGSSLHTGSSGTSAQCAVWGYTEQMLSNRLGVILDYSHAFGHKVECTDFAGIGLMYASGKSTIGLFSDYARFCHTSEWASEFIFKHQLTETISVQTACHFIYQDSWQPVGLVRLSIRI